MQEYKINLLAIGFLLTFCVKVFAQSETTKPIGKIIYLQQTEATEEKKRNGLSYLLFNQNESLYIQTGAPATAVVNPNWDQSSYSAGDKLGFPIYKDHRARHILFRTFCYKRELGSHCVVEDTLGTIDWLIDPSVHMRFGAYECLKATGHFRGRDYEVWFTPDIPISSGPFKLGGLPGMILEARTTDGLAQFLFQSLELSPDMDGQIQKPEGSYTGLNYEENKVAFINNLKKIAAESNAEGSGQITIGEMPANAWIEVW